MIGVDVVSISRIERMMERFGSRALDRFLHPSEQALIKQPRTAAGFWAAKEAISKALECGIGAELSFHDITLSKTPKGAPKATLSKEALTSHNVKDLSISITHDGDLAIAVALVVK